jgi:hypothetical protein
MEMLMINLKFQFIQVKCTKLLIRLQLFVNTLDYKFTHTDVLPVYYRCIMLL